MANLSTDKFSTLSPLTPRGNKVAVDYDLSELYGVKTKALNQAVKRNTKRFPADFCFQINKKEKQQLVTICDRFATLKHSSVLPNAFSEQGVAMLSSVLKSEKAIEVNVLIMRAFVRLRRVIAKNKDLTFLFQRLKHRVDRHDTEIGLVIKASDKKPR